METGCGEEYVEDGVAMCDVLDRPKWRGRVGEFSSYAVKCQPLFSGEVVSKC